jgi:hypothetical protein
MVTPSQRAGKTGGILRGEVVGTLVKCWREVAMISISSWGALAGNWDRVPFGYDRRRWDRSRSCGRRYATTNELIFGRCWHSNSSKSHTVHRVNDQTCSVEPSLRSSDAKSGLRMATFSRNLLTFSIKPRTSMQNPGTFYRKSESEGILPNTGTQHCYDRTDGYSCQLEADILMQRSLLKQGKVLPRFPPNPRNILPKPGRTQRSKMPRNVLRCIRKSTKHFSRNLARYRVNEEIIFWA